MQDGVFRRNAQAVECVRPVLKALEPVAYEGFEGAEAPEDPGAGELAQLLDEIVERLTGDRSTKQARSTAKLLAQAAEAMRAVARLGGLLPAISLWHLRTALRHEAVARDQLAEHNDPQPAASRL
ncbi:hypothetical protein ACGFS9_31430 [Streptomyces sp. NPDC048566]|uniref:hypothetical protein n=1 Tax=Streptomyces sp. NPDC048566 TaxID=3365569 RepID=UPI003721119F